MMRSLLVAIGLGALLAAQAPLEQEVLVAYPHRGPSPLDPASVPAIRNRGGEVVRGPAPAAGALGRDQTVGDSFGDEGQRVAYAFEAEEGELSLFEMECWGFSRGWSSVAGVRILDEEGTLHLERELGGGPRYGGFVAFRAPRAATYSLELSSRLAWYRYNLVRHSGFQVQLPHERYQLAPEQDLAHGYLARGGESMRYALPVSAGERVVVTIEHPRRFHQHPMNRGRETKLERALSDAHRDAPDLDGASRVNERSRATDGDAPRPQWALRVVGERAPTRSRAPRLDHVAREDGLLAFDVVSSGLSEGAIFVLRIERSPQLHAVTGRVGDEEDEPVEGARLVFLLEPSLAEVAEAVTDAEGEYALELPTGDYSVLLVGGTRASMERVRTRVEGERELHLVRSWD